jgi:galactokinase
MTQPLDRASELFTRTHGRPPDFVARAPGRVNLLGEHIDYNDGFVLPAAIDRAAYVAARGTDGDSVSLQAPDISSAVRFRVGQVDEKVDAEGQPLPRWAWYPAGVAWALREKGLAVAGLEAVLASDVPRASGLSSSAAVEVAFATAWQRLGGWRLAPMELALACQRAENQYVGVNSGIMDQFASACGQAGHALLLDCRSLTWEAVPLPADVAIVVADTTKRRELGQSEYNARRQQCEAAVAALAQALPGLRSLRDVPLEAFNRYASRLEPVVAKRARHVVEEIARTVAGAEALKAGRVEEFGRLMNDGHASLRDLYEVSIPELDVMVEAAQRLPGCFGARLTGAGFGGCTVNLVAAEAAADFERDLARAYERATGLRPDIYVSRASAGAGIV